jgi:hypothetical protein
MVLSVTPPPPVSGVRGAATSTGGAVANDPTAGSAGMASASAQASTVISAKVQQIIAENLVQVAIGNLLLELASDVPLQVGQTVQLAVSQTDQGVRLAIVGTEADPASATVVDVAGQLNPVIAPASDRLTGLERLAVSIATEEAATQQGGQGQLFADLNAVADGPSLPPALRAAIAQVLAQQTSLDANLTGEDVKNAFQSSGLLLEASLATGSPAAPDGKMPDLKAALIVLRQALASVMQTTGSGAEQANGAQPHGPTSYAPSTAAKPQQLALTFDANAEHPVTAAPSLAPEMDAEVLPRQQMGTTQGSAGRLQLADAGALNAAAGNTLPGGLMQAKPQSLTPSAVLTLLQEAQQQIARSAGFTGPRSGFQDAAHGDVVRTNTPPPPFRGSLPTPQAIASPSLTGEAPLHEIAHRLLDQTDAALSRQTLLQVASLPDRTDNPGARVDPTAPRWNFEIPFATPQGTAMAQFEISRDGGTQQERDAAKRVWRARFSLDVEPAGPVHALITQTGERTSVRMWAERPATAAQLRAGIADLGQALNRAELSPGDIVVQLGTPPAAAPPKAGHFLDRAL